MPTYGAFSAQGRGGVQDPIQANPALSAAYRQQTEDAQRAKQEQLRQQERYVQDSQARNMALAAQRNALSGQSSLMADPTNPRTSNGMEMNISNTGGGGSGSQGVGRSGLAIGGGVFPDISGLMAQLKTMGEGNVKAPGHVGTPQVPQNTGAFAHAKDVAGRVGNKAIEALRNSMTRRGISDSGLAAVGEANILGNVARQQSDALYDETQQNTARQWEANQMGYQGDIAQNQMAYEGDLSQRQHNLQAILQLMNLMY